MSGILLEKWRREELEKREKKIKYEEKVYKIMMILLGCAIIIITWLVFFSGIL